MHMWFLMPFCAICLAMYVGREVSGRLLPAARGPGRRRRPGTPRATRPCAPAAREAEQAGCGRPGVGPAAALSAAGGSQ